MDPENAENVEPQSDEQYFKGINKGFMIVVALICLVLKLFGLIKWSHLIFATIASPFILVGLAYALCGLLKVIEFCLRPGISGFLFKYLIFCLVLELYRVEVHSEFLTTLAMGCRGFLSWIIHIPLCILGFVDQETAMAQTNQFVIPYTYSLYNVFTFMWGIPFFIAFVVINAIASIFVGPKGKPTLIGKVTAGAVVGTAAGAAAGYVLRRARRCENE